jgi:hypothetical protein
MRIALLSCREFKIPGGAERLEIDIALALNASIVCLMLIQNFKKYIQYLKVLHSIH